MFIFLFTLIKRLRNCQVLDSKFLDGTTNSSMKDPEQLQCHHDYMLKEDLGVICRLCNFICTEIRYVTPPFVSLDASSHDSFDDFCATYLVDA